MRIALELGADDVLALVLCAVVAALVSAAFGPTALWLGDVASTRELGSVFGTGLQPG